MIGHQVAVVLRIPARARLPLRPSPFQCQRDIRSRATFTTCRQLNAIPGRPRKAVGEPSRPVKRAVKRAAPKAASDTPAADKVAAKKETAAKKKKTTAKQKAGPKKEKRKATAATKQKKPAKVLTEEQKAAKKASREKAVVKDLKLTALSPPKIVIANAYVTFSQEKMKKGLQGEKDVKNKISGLARQTAAEFKALDPAGLEHYNHLAHTAKERSQAEYKSWVESHTPEEIDMANRSRRILRRKLPRAKRTRTRWPAIHDERAVKRGLTAFVQFSMNRQGSADFKNIAMTERARLIGKEWKALSEGEKEKYTKLQTQDRERYVEEYSSVYGHAPPTHMNGAQQAA